ncbi:MAG: sigma-70 family RNA polymerase sigma factor [Kofleriaceae bacterium]
MSDGAFPLTRPSAVSDLLSGDPARRARSLDLVVRGYWKPVYKYIRLRWTQTGEHAEDLTQSFFETAINRDMLAQYQPARGRFRTFLRTCLDRHVIDQHRRAATARRGGKNVHLDFATAEAELGASGANIDPDAVFDAEWLRHLMQLALERLDAALEERKKPVHAKLFRDFHVGDSPPAYAAAAERYGITTTDVTNWLHVARREFRRVAMDLLRELTIDDEDFAAEARAVFGIDVDDRSEPAR